MRICVCVSVSEGSAPSTGVGRQPQGTARGAAAGQTECLSPTAGGIHVIPVCVCILGRAPPCCSAREGSGMRLLVLSVLMGVLCVSDCVDWCGWPCISVCMWCTRVISVQVPTGNKRSASLQVGSGAWSCGSLTSLRLSDPF